MTPLSALEAVIARLKMKSKKKTTGKDGIIALNAKRKSIIIVFYALTMLTILAIRTAKASSPTEWTQNSSFAKSGYQWDPILYDWQMSLPWPFPSGNDTYECFVYDNLNHALWLQDGLVQLAAHDSYPYNFYGRSARVTYGHFIDPYPSQPPIPIRVNSTNSLTLEGVISNYGSVNDLLPNWTGIKFDAWFNDSQNNHPEMVIEMYFHGTGLQGAWGNEWKRTLGYDIDDYLIKLQAFPQYCTITGDVPISNFAVIGSYTWDNTHFSIDLKGIWQKAASILGRSSRDTLYAVALDVESGCTPATPTQYENVAFAEVNEIMVTYTSPPNTPSTPSGPSSGYRWTRYTFTSSTTDPNDDRLWYQFDWGDGSSSWTWRDYASGEVASASHSWSSIGAYPVRVRAKDSTGLYSDWSQSTKMNIINKPGNPCPTLFAWNGSRYVEIGILDIHANSDVTFMQGIEQTLVADKHLYKLSLRELDEFTSYIDHVKLYVVDNDVRKQECHLVQAAHNELGQVESLLLLDDDKRVDLNPQQAIDLRFTVPNVNEVAYFIFEINGYNIKP